MGVRISALTETTTMADANTLPTDTTGGTRRISWANLKAFLKTYFDSLYTVQASYYANTMAGNGSTATKIPYYTNQPTNSPNGQFTVANSATNGLSITINVAGVYAFTASFDTGVGYAGLSLNASSLTTNIQSLAVTERLGCAYVNSIGEAIQVTAVRRFAVNDVIRPHTAGQSAATAATNNFNCERVSA